MAPRSIWNGTIASARSPSRSRCTRPPRARPCASSRCTKPTRPRIEHKRVAARRRRGALRRHRQGLRGRRGRVRRAREGGGRRRGRRAQPPLDIEEFVDADRDRPRRLRPHVLPRARATPTTRTALLHDALDRTGRAGIAAGCSTTASTSSRSGRSGAVLRCTRCASTTSSSTRRSSTCPAPQRKPTEREIKMAGSLIDTLHTEFDPEMLTRTPTASTCSTPRQEGARARRPSPSRRSRPRPPTTCSPRSRRA